MLINLNNSVYELETNGQHHRGRRVRNAKVIGVSFRNDERGSITITFGLTIFALIGAVALAVDFARLTSARTSLVVMTDAAALAGATYLPTSKTLALAKAHDAFDAQRAKNATSVTRTIQISADGTSVVATASATVDLMFAVFGASQMTVSAGSTAERQIGYLDVQLLLDVSASMGLAASPTEMQRMKDLTRPYIAAYVNSAANINNTGLDWLRSEQTCAFACHSREGWEPNGGTALGLARANNVLLRWDVVTAAATAMATSILDGQTNSYGAVVQVGGYAAADDVRQVFPLTTSSNSIGTLISNTNLMGFNTSLNDALGKVPGLIGSSGNGMSPQTSKKVLVLATDGVDGVRGGAHAPVDTARCDAIKSTGVTIAVIDVTYVKDTASVAFNGAVASMYDQIAPNLQACASSPDLYIAASDPSAITAAFVTMAQRVLNLKSRLVQ